MTVVLLVLGSISKEKVLLAAAEHGPEGRL